MKELLFPERKELLESIKLYLDKNGNKLISIEGTWGTGKSFFVNELKNNSDLTYIIIDCWDYQGVDDIYYAIMDSITNDPSKLEKVSLTLKSILDKKLGDIGIEKDTYENYSQYKIHKLFFDALNNEIEDKKLVIVFDELDRCNPEYALSTIQKIYSLKKHVVSENINYIISFNKHEFTHIMNHFYGQNYNSSGYFDKLFNYEFSLPIGNSKIQYFTSFQGKYNNEFNLLLRNRKYPIINDEFEKLSYRELGILLEKTNSLDIPRGVCDIVLSTIIVKYSNPKKYGEIEGILNKYKFWKKDNNYEGDISFFNINANDTRVESYMKIAEELIKTIDLGIEVKNQYFLEWFINYEEKF